MTKKIGTIGRKTRNKFKKRLGEKGKVSLSSYFHKYEVGDKVALTVDSSIKKGMYHPRFHGRIGTIKGKEGRCYKVSIKDQNKLKLLKLHPVHLRKV